MEELSLVPGLRSLQRRARFYFIRHGESESNKAGIIQGHQNSPLSATGQEHAEAAGRWFADKQIDRVYSSPLDRGMQTAATIASACGVSEPEPVPELIEIDTGLFSGKSLATLATDHPDAFEQFLVYSWESVPDAESIGSLRRRAFAVWQRLFAAARNGAAATVSVTHGGMLQWLIKATFANGGTTWMPLFAADNCGIFLFVVDPVSRGIPGGGAGEGTRADAGRPVANGRPAVDAELTPTDHVGYFGQWQQMNLIPYSSSCSDSTACQ